MINITNQFEQAICSPVRVLKAKVEVYQSSTLVNTYTQDDNLVSLEIQRNGESGKFFGFGVSHRLNVKLSDFESEVDISTANNLRVYIGVQLANNTVEYCGFPLFYVTEVHRDERKHIASITAYDNIKLLETATLADLHNLETPYTIAELASQIASRVSTTASGNTGTQFATEYESGANFEGDENLRDILDRIAEATQTIYFFDYENVLTFRRMEPDEDESLLLTRDDFFELETGSNRRLKTVCHYTELGDNISASITANGSIQYVRNNGFWELRTDIADLVDTAIENVGGLEINEFEMKWRGNPALEIGDKICVVYDVDEDENEKYIYTYLLSDTLTYDGGLEQKSEWEFEEDNSETASNPTSLGDVINTTYARVDKQKKEIEIIASQAEETKANVAQIQIDTNTITQSVADTKQTIEEMADSINNQLVDITNRVEQKMDAESVQLAIETEMANGVDKVVTSTGFRFDADGLTISKTGVEMTTNIDEDGMTVYKGNSAVLTADNTGVTAKNLRANYIIIGKNSRFEDYGNNRTGCFWIGG